MVSYNAPKTCHFDFSKQRIKNCISWRKNLLLSHLTKGYSFDCERMYVTERRHSPNSSSLFKSHSREITACFSCSYYLKVKWSILIISHHFPIKESLKIIVKIEVVMVQKEAKISYKRKKEKANHIKIIIVIRGLSALIFIHSLIHSINIYTLSP